RIIGYRPSPFVVVIRHVVGGTRAPPASHLAILAPHQPIRRHRRIILHYPCRQSGTTRSPFRCSHHDNFAAGCRCQSSSAAAGATATRLTLTGCCCRFLSARRLRLCTSHGSL